MSELPGSNTVASNYRTLSFRWRQQTRHSRVDCGKLGWHTNTYELDGRSVCTVFNAVICCDALALYSTNGRRTDRTIWYARPSSGNQPGQPVARPVRHKSDRIPALVRCTVARDLSSEPAGISPLRRYNTFTEWDKIADTHAVFCTINRIAHQLLNCCTS